MINTPKKINLLLVINKSLSDFIHSLHLLPPLCLGFPLADIYIYCPHELCQKLAQFPFKIQSPNSTFKLNFINKKISYQQNNQNITFINSLTHLNINTIHLLISINTRKKIKDLIKCKVNHHLNISSAKNTSIPNPISYYFKTLQKIDLYYTNQQQITCLIKFSNIKKHKNNNSAGLIVDKALSEQLYETFLNSTDIISNHQDIILLSQIFNKNIIYKHPIPKKLFYTFYHQDILSIYMPYKGSFKVVQQSKKEYIKNQTLIFVSKNAKIFKYVLEKNKWNCTSDKQRANIILLKDSFLQSLILYWNQLFFTKQTLIIASSIFELNLKLEGYLNIYDSSITRTRII